MLARWIVRTLEFCFRKIPSRCSRQLGSVEVMYSAPEDFALPAFVSHIAPEIIANFVANVPPKPQQSSL